ncbi:MAG: hypothetical protein R6U68_16805, partial [Desulfobacteraceae bacterium]
HLVFSFCLAGKKSSVVLVPDRQLLGAAVFIKLDNRVTGQNNIVENKDIARKETIYLTAGRG